MENNIAPNNYPSQSEEEEIDFKRYFYLLLRRWYWLLAFLILGIGAAFFYGTYKQETYLVETKIIVPESGGHIDLQMFFEDNLPIGKKASIFNEIELLKSYTLNQQAFEVLSWRTSWYKRSFLSWNSIYTNEPFRITEPENAINAEEIFIDIEPIGDNKFKVEASGKGFLNDNRNETDVFLSTTGTFGQPVKNDFFYFTVHKKNQPDISEDEHYRFKFNNKNISIRDYLKKINIEQTEKQSEVIRVWLEGPETRRQVDYLNQLIEVYLDLKLQQETRIQERSLAFIKNQLEIMHDSLQRVSANFTNFRANNQIINLSAQGELTMEQLGEIEGELAQQNIKLDYFNNLLTYIQKDETIDELTAPSVLGIEDQTLNALVLQLSETYNRRKSLSLSAHENSPILNRLNSEIVQIKKQLRESLLNLIDNTEIAIRNLETRYAKISSQLQKLPVKEQQLININRQYELTNEVYTFLLQKRAELEIALASAVVDIQIIDPARVESAIPKGTSKPILLILGAFIGLLIPISSILGSDALNSKIHFQEDVEKLTRLSIVGNVLHSKIKDELVVLHHPKEPISESYRTIRTNIQYKFTDRNAGRVISIHSLSPGEGKTFSSSNIASILAINNKKVLLIGADMRKPRLNQVFKSVPQAEAGLSTFLAGKYTYQDVIIDSENKNLKILQAGPVPPDPSELLENHNFADLVQKARNDFDYIVIDNAPVSMVTDGYITGRHSDLNLFILRYGVSRKTQLKFINDVAGKKVIKNIALIINDIKVNKFSSGYSYNYSYARGY